MSLLTVPEAECFVGDQARELRALVSGQSSHRERSRPESVRSCRSLAVLSGKGGVGKSVVALNLAMALAHRGESIGLWDASAGVGHLSLLCGQNGYWNLSHVLAGSRRLDEIVLHGPNGIRIVPGVGHLSGISASAGRIVQSLADCEKQHDWLIVDAGVCASPTARQFACSADCALLVTTPEPTAVAETYAAMKSLASTSGGVVSVLVNQADSEQQALQILERLRHAARTFLHSDISRAGYVPRDEAVCRSVGLRKPLATIHPDGPAQQAIVRVAERIHRTVAAHRGQSFTERMVSSNATTLDHRESAQT